MTNFRLLAIVVSIFSIVFGNVSHSAELRVPGLGSTSCEAVARMNPTDDQNNIERRQLEQWGQGYLSGLMTAHAIQFARASEEVMGTAITIDYNSSRSWVEIVTHCQERTTDNFAQAIMAVAVKFGVFQDEDPSVPGVYLLIEVNGAQLPTVLWASKPNGERCKTEIIEGALLFDAEGRSAAFLTESEVCLLDDGSESASKENSVIFPGSYVVSGNQITIEDDFGTDQAVLNGNILVYESGGESKPITEFTFRRE